MQSDLVECVIGLGANLFYNSPMEACVIICRTNKAVNRRGQILFINAINEVTRKNAQSWLDDAHIKKIADTYENYSDTPGFAKVVTIADTAKNNYSLSIPLYVREAENPEAVDMRTAQECATAWLESAFDMHLAYEDLKLMLEGAMKKKVIYRQHQSELLMVAEKEGDYNLEG